VESGHEFERTTPLNAPESTEHDFASVRCGLELLCCWRTFVTVFHWLLFWGWKWCTQLSSPVTVLHKNLSPSRSYRGNNCRQTSIRFCFNSSDDSGNTSRAQLSVSGISSYHMHSLTWNSSFVCCCMLRNWRLCWIISSRRFRWASSVAVRGLSLAACHSVRRIRGLRRGHVQPNNVGQCRCLHSRPHEQLPFTDECKSVERFLQSKSHSLHSVYPALTSFLYTAPSAWL
jgi:hypothetical protein